MKRSEKLKIEITALTEERKKALKEESKVLIWKDDCRERKDSEKEETICFFNLSKARLLLTALNEGKALLLEHGAMGDYVVYMNPQRNRINVERQQKQRDHEINEDNVMSFIVWHAGDWYDVNPDIYPIIFND